MESGIRENFVSIKVYREGSRVYFDLTARNSKKLSDMTSTFSNSISPPSIMEKFITSLILALGDISFMEKWGTVCFGWSPAIWTSWPASAKHIHIKGSDIENHWITMKSYAINLYPTSSSTLQRASLSKMSKNLRSSFHVSFLCLRSTHERTIKFGFLKANDDYPGGFPHCLFIMSDWLLARNKLNEYHTESPTTTMRTIF